jgi:hypothetical protein
MTVGGRAADIYLVGAHEQRERDGEAERLRSLEVDEQLGLGGCSTGRSAGFVSLRIRTV